MPDPSGQDQLYKVTLPFAFVKHDLISGAIPGQQALGPDYIITPNTFAGWNWLEVFHVTAADIAGDHPGELPGAVGNEVNIAMRQALNPFIGKPLKDLPDTITIYLPEWAIFGKWRPFATILPGVPNPGVDPITGATPIDSLLGATAPIGAFFTWLLSINWLMVIAAAVGAFLLYKAWQQLNEQDAIPNPA